MGNVFCKKNHQKTPKNTKNIQKDDPTSDEKMYFEIWSKVIKEKMQSEFTTNNHKMKIYFVNTKLIGENGKHISVRYLALNFKQNHFERQWILSGSNDWKSMDFGYSECMELKGIGTIEDVSLDNFYKSDEDDRFDRFDYGVNTIEPIFCSEQFIVTSYVTGKRTKCFIQFDGILKYEYATGETKKINYPLHPRNLTSIVVDEWRKSCADKINTMSIIIKSSTNLPIEIINFSILTFIFPRASDLIY